MSTAGPIVVMGAGAVGGFVGGRLAAAGNEVHFVGRAATFETWRSRGLGLTDLEHAERQLRGEALRLHAQPPPLAGALVLLTVKCGATRAAARQLAAALPPGTPVLSLQNGVRNVDEAAQVAPGLVWIPGVVAFNVAELAPGHLHRGTSGGIAAAAHAALAPWLPHLAAAGLAVQTHADLRPVQWGKLLLNLNNPVNALAGLPLRAQLLDRDCRRVTAALQAEALGVLAAAGIRPASLTPLAPHWTVRVLRLPTPLFRIVAARLLRIDASARSSMADDLARGRTTEIDAICGAVVRLAQTHGRDAPLNRRMVEWLDTAGPARRSGKMLRQALGI